MGAGLLAVFEAVAVAVELEDVDVMGQPVEPRAGEAFGAEDLGPFVEGEMVLPSSSVVTPRPAWT